MRKHQTRSRLLVDSPIQFAIIVRAVTYWTVCLTMQILAIAFLPILFHPSQNLYVVGEQFWWTLGFGILGSIVALPLIVMDILRLSHRWVGPVYRLRSYLRSLRNGQPVGSLNFRASDFWRELAVDVNSIVTELTEARARLANSPSLSSTVFPENGFARRPDESQESLSELPV
jgi:hypothetical protein